MKKTLLFGAAAVAILFLGAGCSKQQANAPAANGNSPSPSANAPSGVSESSFNANYPVYDGPSLSSTVNFFISNEDPNKYCNGADMDSDGYRKTINVQRSVVTAQKELTQTQLVIAAIKAASGERCQNLVTGGVVDGIKVANGVVTIPPIDAWAGVSITMCSCKPLFEVNALNVPGVTKVVWQ